MKSPGHAKWPRHQVREHALHEQVRVEVDGRAVASSRDVIRVDEDDHPPRYYFPREDVDRDLLERSDTVTTCPFKGKASYFHLKVGGRVIEDAVWTYEDPYDEHRGLKGRLAFYDEPGLELKLSPELSPANATPPASPPLTPLQ